MVVATRIQNTVQSLLRIYPGFGVPSFEQIPINLTAIRNAGLGEYIDKETKAKLLKFESEFNKNFNAAPILLASGKRTLYKAMSVAAPVAFSYYFDTGRAIWHSIENDYPTLRELTITASKAVEATFFAHTDRLTRKSFSKTIAGIRILRDTGERIIRQMEITPLEDRIPPFTYFCLVFYGGFFTTCMLSHVNGDVEGASASNLRLLADMIFDAGNAAHEMAAGEHLYEDGGAWFWHPQWQLGEAEADLDRIQNRVRQFDSVGALIADLRQ